MPYSNIEDGSESLRNYVLENTTNYLYCLFYVLPCFTAIWISEDLIYI